MAATPTTAETAVAPLQPVEPDADDVDWRGWSKVSSKRCPEVWLWTGTELHAWDPDQQRWWSKTAGNTSFKWTFPGFHCNVHTAPKQAQNENWRRRFRSAGGSAQEAGHQSDQGADHEGNEADHAVDKETKAPAPAPAINAMKANRVTAPALKAMQAKAATRMAAAAIKSMQATKATKAKRTPATNATETKSTPSTRGSTGDEGHKGSTGAEGHQGQ